MCLCPILCHRQINIRNAHQGIVMSSNPANARTCSSGSPDSSWHLVGEGIRTPDCGKPIIYHQSKMGSYVWAHHQCTRRECPLCADDRYVTDETSTLVETVLSWIQSYARLGAIYRPSDGKSLKVYSIIFSWDPKDRRSLKDQRRAMYECLKAHGIEAAICILHPYRGDHDMGSSPAEVRSRLERSSTSIHWHVIGLGYWSTPGSIDGEIYKATTLRATDRLNDQGIIRHLRNRLNRIVRYAIGHAGWYGQRGQAVTRMGTVPVEDLDIAPDPVEMIEVPGETAEPRTHGIPGEVPNWEYAAGDDGYLGYNDTACPKSGQVQSGDIYPWWHLSECRKSLDRTCQEPWEWLLMVRIGAQRILRYDDPPPRDVLEVLAKDILDIEKLCRERKTVTAPLGEEGSNTT